MYWEWDFLFLGKIPKQSVGLVFFWKSGWDFDAWR